MSECTSGEGGKSQLETGLVMLFIISSCHSANGNWKHSSKFLPHTRVRAQMPHTRVDQITRAFCVKGGDGQLLNGTVCLCSFTGTFFCSMSLIVLVSEG